MANFYGFFAPRVATRAKDNRFSAETIAHFSPGVTDANGFNQRKRCAEMNVETFSFFSLFFIVFSFLHFSFFPYLFIFSCFSFISFFFSFFFHFFIFSFFHFFIFSFFHVYIIFFLFFPPPGPLTIATRHHFFESIRKQLSV